MAKYTLIVADKDDKIYKEGFNDARRKAGLNCRKLASNLTLMTS